MHPESLSSLFVRQAKRAGLSPIRLHDLRHSVASILLAQGVHPKVVSEQLGHATIALTLGHLQPRHSLTPAGSGRRWWRLTAHWWSEGLNSCSAWRRSER